MARTLFTSESVSMGHPDKVADQISDAVLDALLEQDPNSRVACETMVTTGLCILAGEITTTARVNYQDIARNTLKRIGYTSDAYGINGDTCAVMVSRDRQSPDISQGVTEGEGLHSEQGAGDHGDAEREGEHVPVEAEIERHRNRQRQVRVPKQIEEP